MTDEIQKQWASERSHFESQIQLLQNSSNQQDNQNKQALSSLTAENESLKGSIHQLQMQVQNSNS